MCICYVAFVIRVRDIAINSKPTTENTRYENEILPNILAHSIHIPGRQLESNTTKSRYATIDQNDRNHVCYLSTEKVQHELRWYDHVQRLNGPASTILQGTKREKRSNRENKHWQDNIKE